MPGCFCTDKITAGLPSKPARPAPPPALKLHLGHLRQAHRHACGAPTGRLAVVFDAAAAADARISHSCPWRSMKPPALLAAKPATAASTASTRRPARASRRVGHHPPLLHAAADRDHLGHPGTASRRGRRHPSRRTSRTASGLARAWSMGRDQQHSPMIGAIRPQLRHHPGRQALAHRAGRSVTLSGACARCRPHSNSTYTSDSPTPTPSAPGDAGHAVHRGLEGEADQLLDLLPAPSRRPRSSGSRWACRGRERHPPAGAARRPRRQQGQRGSQHEQPVWRNQPTRRSKRLAGRRHRTAPSRARPAPPSVRRPRGRPAPAPGRHPAAQPEPAAA